MTIDFKKFTIIVDQDDVLTKTNERLIELYNRDWDDDLTVNSIKGWNWHTWVRPECGDRVYDYLNMPGFFFDMDPVEGAIEGLQSLISDGHDVVVATASPIDSRIAHYEKIDWLRKWVPSFPLSHFASMHRKELLRGDVLFDDGPHNCADFPGISIMLAKPWNRGEMCRDSSVNSWQEFLGVIKEMSRNSNLYHHMMHAAQRRMEAHGHS